MDTCTLNYNPPIAYQIYIYFIPHVLRKIPHLLRFMNDEIPHVLQLVKRIFSTFMQHMWNFFAAHVDFIYIFLNHLFCSNFIKNCWNTTAYLKGVN